MREIAHSLIHNLHRDHDADVTVFDSARVHIATTTVNFELVKLDSKGSRELQTTWSQQRRIDR